MKKVLISFMVILLVMVMMASSALPAMAAPAAGDVNGDGQVNLLDVMIGLRLLSGKSYGGTHRVEALFVNGDAFADLSDLVSILRKTAGWNLTLAAGPEGLSLTKTDGGIFYYEDALLKVVSQNIYQGDQGRVDRIERFRTLFNGELAPEVFLLQEYRWGSWFNAWEGTTPSREYVNFNKDGSEGNSYFVSVSADSILGAGFEGLVLSRAEVDQDTKAEAAALTKANGGVATVENAYQVDERLAIFWDGEKYEPAQDGEGNPVYGKFYFSETPEVYSASFGSDPVTILDSGTIGSASYEFYVDGTARIGMWIKLKNCITQKEFYVFNLHGANLDDKEALEYSDDVARIIVDQAKKAQILGGDAPAILGGDLNIDYYNPVDAEGFAILDANFDDTGEQMRDLRGTATMWGKNVGVASSGHPAKEGFTYVRGDLLFRQKNDERATPLSYTVLEQTFDANHLVKYETMAEAAAAGEAPSDLLYASDHLGVYAEYVLWN